jgi:hypothetical protein
MAEWVALSLERRASARRRCRAALRVTRNVAGTVAGRSGATLDSRPRAGNPPSERAKQRAADRIMVRQGDLIDETGVRRQPDVAAFFDWLRGFSAFGTRTLEHETELRPTPDDRVRVPTFVNEFWTSRQRVAHSLHEISYRACFKPQLPRFFVDAFTDPGEHVLDPFMGRGTTVVEAALRGRIGIGKDVNPISAAITAPRLDPPTHDEVAARLADIPLDREPELPAELLVFYHEDTLREIVNLRTFLLERRDRLDRAERWIRMVAMNRLTGHSPGFFSVYTMPPNQAVSAQRQARINEKRNQVPPRRDVRAILLTKTRSLLAGLTASDRRLLEQNAARHRTMCGDSGDLRAVPERSVSLLVTSPPFLDVVDYAGDNWLRCWFLGVDPHAVPISIARNVEAWTREMTRMLSAVRPTLARGAVVAFEVGEVRGGKVLLEEHAALAGLRAGLRVEGIVVNRQAFTKTANCWGIRNNANGTNTNRIVLMTRPD